MKKIVRRSLPAFLVCLALLAFLLTGCADNTATDEGTAAAGQSAKPAATTPATAAAATEEPSNLNPAGVFPVVKEKVSITAMVVLNPGVSDMVDNTYTQWLEEKTNVHLDMTVTPSDGYSDKLKIALNSGDYTEIIMSSAAPSNNDVVNYGIKEKIYVPLNGYIDAYGINLNARLDEMPEIRDCITAPDGNIYALPTFEGAVGHGAVSYKCWLNLTWLDKLGIETPTTTEEFEALLTAIKTQDPNGNGKADEVPLSGAIGTWAADPYLFILNAFDYYDTSLLKYKDGTFSFCADTEGFKEGLRYMSGLYEKGLLDPASLTQDLKQLQQLANNDPTVLGVYTAGHLAMGISTANMDLSQAYSYLLPLEGPGGYQGIPASTKLSLQGGAFAITDKCKNPEAAFRVADLFYDPETVFSQRYGPKGEVWDDADPGTQGITGIDAVYKIIKANYSDVPLNNYWAGATSYGFIKQAKEKIQFTGDIYDTANYESRLVQATAEYVKYAADVDQIMPMWADADTATALTNQFTPISDYVKSAIVQFITGKKDVDSDWDAYIADLEKLDYKGYVSAYQAAYDSGE